MITPAATDAAGDLDVAVLGWVNVDLVAIVDGRAEWQGACAFEADGESDQVAGEGLASSISQVSSSYISSVMPVSSTPTSSEKVPGTPAGAFCHHSCTSIR